MPIRIRLSLRGCTNRPFFHIVVAHSQFKRDGRHLEQHGTLHHDVDDHLPVLLEQTSSRIIKLYELLKGTPDISSDQFCVYYKYFAALVREKKEEKHVVGSFDPMPNYNNEKLVALNIDRIRYWLGVGVQPTKSVAKILGLAGVLPVFPRTYLETERRKQAKEHPSVLEPDIDNSEV